MRYFILILLGLLAAVNMSLAQTVIEGKSAREVKVQRNYIKDGDAESYRSGWVAYTDAAASRPVDGTFGGGSVTMVASATTPLAQNKSFVLTLPGAVQGQGVSYDFNIDASAKAAVLDVSFDYVVNSGTFVAGSSTTDSDLIVYLYDKTNSRLIEPSSFKLLSNSTTVTDKFSGTFQTSSDSTSYRLILHVARSNSASSLKIDDIVVAKSQYTYGSPISDWASYTPTLNQGSGNGTINARWRRVGDSIEIFGQYGAGGTAATANISFTPPTGIAIDSTKHPSANGTYWVGKASYYKNTTGQAWDGVVAFDSPNFVVTSESGSTNLQWNGTNPVASATQDSIKWYIKFPVLGWSSSVQMSSEANTRVVAANAYRITSAQTITAGSDVEVIFNAISKDTHGTFSTSTGRYNVSVSGLYRVSYGLRATMGATAAALITSYIKKNGTGTLYGAFYTDNLANSKTYQASGSTVIELNANDYISVFINAASQDITIGNTASSNEVSYFNIERISGPSQIAASESVSASYVSTSGTSISNSGETTVDFATKISDSHGAVTTGASWKFTAPISGRYSISCVLQFQSSAYSTGNRIYIRLYQTGSSTNNYIISREFMETSVTDSVVITGSKEIHMLAGDTVYVAVANSRTGGATSLSTSNNPYHNFIDITRVGN